MLCERSTTVNSDDMLLKAEYNQGSHGYESVGNDSLDARNKIDNICKE